MDGQAPTAQLRLSRVHLVIVIGGLALLMVAAVGGALLHGHGSTATVTPAQRSRYDNGLGYLTAAATPYAGDVAHPRRPLQAVPLIAASGACLTAMDSMRELMHAVPSGGLLPRAPGWARLVAPRMGQVNRVCGPATAQAFRDQEFLPWNGAAIPAGARIPAAPKA